MYTDIYTCIFICVNVYAFVFVPGLDPNSDIYAHNLESYLDDLCAMCVYIYIYIPIVALTMGSPSGKPGPITVANLIS